MLLVQFRYQSRVVPVDLVGKAIKMATIAVAILITSSARLL